MLGKSFQLKLLLLTNFNSSKYDLPFNKIYSVWSVTICLVKFKIFEIGAKALATIYRAFDKDISAKGWLWIVQSSPSRNLQFSRNADFFGDFSTKCKFLYPMIESNIPGYKN